MDFLIQGMTCGHCKAAVEKAVAKIDGVENVSVDLEKGRASVQGSAFDQNAVMQAVSAEGYEIQVC